MEVRESVAIRIEPLRVRAHFGLSLVQEIVPVRVHEHVHTGARTAQFRADEHLEACAVGAARTKGMFNRESRGGRSVAKGPCGLKLRGVRIPGERVPNKGDGTWRSVDRAVRTPIHDRRGALFGGV